MEFILGEIYVTYITLLIINEKHETVYNIIDKAIKICQKLNFKQVQFKIELILISLEIKDESKDILSRLSDLESLLENTNEEL